MMRDLTRFWIGGDWVAPLSGERLDVEDPATEAVVARIALGSDRDVDRAVAAARAAQPGWAAVPVAERVACLERLLAVTKRRLPELAEAITTEMGAPHDVALHEQAATAVGHLEGFLTALEEFPWEERLPNGETLWREPVGVAGLITPWNWPINQITLKVLPAIAMGCAAVLKPSELTPLSAMLYAEFLAEAGLPGGVVNLVNGTGPVVGAALSRHPGIDMMSFTGSTRAGTQVSRDAAESVKRVTLELGGKGANLVFADCADDLEARVRTSVAEGMLNSGQSCDQPARMIVEASVHDDVCRIAAEAAEATVVGDPREPGDRIGPLAHAAQWDRVQDFIAGAQAEGARCIAGGTGRPDRLTRGHYARPTIFAGVTPGMTIWREEVFGPVLTITPFEGEEEGLRLANDTEYGLAAYVQTGDRDRALRVAKGLRAGMVRVNGAAPGPGSPFGGMGRSGNGREGGRPGLEDFTETKTLTLPGDWR